MSQDTQWMKWSTDWMKDIDPDKLTLYPTQFANCRRLEEHDTIYIFDEVGCGKTISAGLMAIHYLKNHPDLNVLVITDNALVKDSGEFERDWCDRLPFQRLGLTHRFKVINNHYSNIKEIREGPGRFGMVIIDEAHIFLTVNDDPDADNDEEKRRKRYNELMALSTILPVEDLKVVIMTATPLRRIGRWLTEDAPDLRRFQEMADKLLGGKKSDDHWIRDIQTDGKEPRELICSTFDTERRVSRYFKDTVRALTLDFYLHLKAEIETIDPAAVPKCVNESIEELSRNLSADGRPAYRLFPKEWRYPQAEGRRNALCRNIKEALIKKGPKHRFLVFVNWVNDPEDGAEAIAGFLRKKLGLQKDQCMAVYGNSKPSLNDLKDVAEEGTQWPTILVLTWQSASVGVNLPDYDYVVNYHIPNTAAALEQRFGRIDRLNSPPKPLHMAALLQEDGEPDTSTRNYYQALDDYLYFSSSDLPCRNALITEEILEELYKTGNMKPEDYERWKEFKEYIPQGGVVSNHIFYNRTPFSIGGDWKVVPSDICTVDAVQPCKEWISESANYRSFMEQFSKIMVPVLMQNAYEKLYRSKVVRYLEEQFLAGDFEALFPNFPDLYPAQPFNRPENGPDKYWERQNCFFENLFLELVKGDTQFHAPPETKEKIAGYFQENYKKLPFFKLCDLYQRHLWTHCLTTKGEFYKEYNKDPFTAAWKDLAADQEVWRCGLSEKFIRESGLNSGSEQIKKRFYFKMTEGKLSASPWYKLAVQSFIELYRKNTLCWPPEDRLSLRTVFYKVPREPSSCCLGPSAPPAYNYLKQVLPDEFPLTQLRTSSGREPEDQINNQTDDSWTALLIKGCLGVTR